jgi:ABC-type amino acid transport substrate-binding protein
MRAVRVNRQAVWRALLAGLLLAILGWSEPASRRASASETLPHPVLFPLLLNDSPLQDTSLLDEPFKGDLSALIERRLIRVLVTYDRTNFFLVDGAPRGFEYELVQQYRRYLKTRVRRRSWPVTFVFIPVSFDQLLPALEAGWGDIAAAGLTITPERQKRVDFTRPYIRDVKELVVTTAGADDGLRRLEDLAGRDVYVNGSTSYAAHLGDLSGRLTGQGLPPISIVPADHKLADEDILPGALLVDHLSRLGGARGLGPARRRPDCLGGSQGQPRVATKLEQKSWCDGRRNHDRQRSPQALFS